MKRGVIALLLIAVAAGAFYWWTQTPIYAVDQASQALKHHDVDRFHKWVDVHSVADNAVDDLLADPVRHAGTGLLERIVGMAIVSLVREPIVDAMSTQIDHWVEHTGRARPSAMLHVMQPAKAASDEDDDDDDEPAQPKSFFGAIVQFIKPPSLKQIFTDYGLTHKNFRGFGSVDWSDHLAHVGLKFFSPKLQTNYEVTLELANGSGNWRIERIANMQQLVSTLTGG